MPKVGPPEPTRLGEHPWLEPYPDALLECATDMAPGPEARYERTESISLAFVTALRHGSGLFVLTLTSDRICAFTRFGNNVLPSFGLPRSLPSR